MTSLLLLETFNTLYMVFVSGFFAFLIGLPLGVALATSREKALYRTLGALVNIGRSIPFAILMIALIPFTRWIVGTSLGTTASIVPLALAAAPLAARLVEGALKEVDSGLLELSQMMGASKTQLIRKILLPEALPSIIRGVIVVLINLVGYSAMAGLVGGGGLGKVAIQYGYQRFDAPLMFVTILIMVLLVECIELGGKKIVQRLLYKRGNS